MKIDEVRYAGYDCVRLRSEALEVVATHSAGPRILSVRRLPGPNMLARLPDATIERAGRPPFRFIGGHRLWAAPEVPEVTYAPDQHAVDVTTDVASVTLSAPVDGAGLQKTMVVGLDHDHVRIEHSITAHGTTHRLAPWAITQLVPGGTALIPLGTTDPDPYQANASVITWPYSDWHDPLVRIGRDHIEVEAKRVDPVKFGTTLQRGWLAYKLDQHLFVKRTPPTAGPHVDLGATGQCYATQSFIELETLGRLSELEDGEVTTHVETWELYTIDPTSPIAELAESLALDTPSP